LIPTGVPVGPVDVVVVVVVVDVVVVVGRVVVVVDVVVVVGRVVVVVDVVGRVVVVVDEVGWTPPQVTPFTAKDVGGLFEPVQLPMNPGDAEAPVGTLPFHVSFLTVTSDPLEVNTPPQPWVIAWPLGKVKVRVQPFHASPRFLITSDPWNPLCHWLATEYWTSQATAA